MNTLKWALSFATFCGLAWSTTPATPVPQQKAEKKPQFSEEQLSAAELLMGLSFTEKERALMQQDLVDLLTAYEGIRSVPLANSVPPSLIFSPLPTGFQMSTDRSRPVYAPVGKITRPADAGALAYLSVPELGSLLRTGQVTSLELTEVYLDRLARYGPQLKCVITLLADEARTQARKMDEEIAKGHFRSPLHGIPYGIKDLFSLKGVKTTWGAEPYKEQVLDETATVIEKLDQAGAVLLAKLSLGALAWGDVWYDGMTRNPWNPEQGSSGSSAGSASATSAGLVGFSIGTETWGSIVSPATRCGVTGLRPTFGRVSRHGAMALSWSMDKVGPICRSVDGCAMVFDAICGSDGKDNHVIDAPFPYKPASLVLKGKKIGYLKTAFEGNYSSKKSDRATLDKLTELGAELVPITLPDLPINALSIILSAEAAAAFDELTRSGRDDLLVRQVSAAWPNAFRGARHITAVEYINANRIRTRLIDEMDELMQKVDVYLTPAFGNPNMLLTNLTGHPCVVVPNGFSDPAQPTSITFMGKLFDEATLLAVTRAWQQATTHHKQHPPQFP